ncbi:MAG TPA: hypothetical protein VK604_23285 [Bryobacteraceae bacterium]|nr:hypothetical protein [Bryobacteraceae bacterium]
MVRKDQCREPALHSQGSCPHSGGRTGSYNANVERFDCEITSPRRAGQSFTATGLERWLRAADRLPPQRKAAALLLADLYVTCARLSGSHELNSSFRRLGAEFKAGCPQDGPDFSHNFREQAEQIDAGGEAGKLAALVSMGDVCSLKGKREWPDLVIEKGENLLSRFPEDEWTASLQYALARAHAAKLSFAYTDGVPEGGSVALTATERKVERDAAIAQFKSFLQKKPNAPESVLAWQEAWRLLAGLTPSRVPFGCGCE